MGARHIPDGFRPVASFRVNPRRAFQPFQDPGRDASDNDIGGHVLRDHCTGSYHGIISTITILAPIQTRFPI